MVLLGTWSKWKFSLIRNILNKAACITVSVPYINCVEWNVWAFLHSQGTDLDQNYQQGIHQGEWSLTSFASQSVRSILNVSDKSSSPILVPEEMVLKLATKLTVYKHSWWFHSMLIAVKAMMEDREGLDTALTSWRLQAGREIKHRWICGWKTRAGIHSTFPGGLPIVALKMRAYRAVSGVGLSPQ